MAKGLALCIGLNAVDPKHYSGWSGHLTACEADAQDMTQIAKSQDFTATTMLTGDATLETVKRRIEEAAASLRGGDTFMLTYSGHGGQLPDLNHDEPDGLDETWCLFDGELVDDQIYALLGNFQEHVRIIVLSDSCHSGSVVKQAYYHGTADARKSAMGDLPRYRCMPPDAVLATYRKNKAFYDPILRDRNLIKRQESVKASVLLISGCHDNQLSQDGNFNGLFTSRLLSVWDDGSFEGGYRKFHKQIKRSMPPDQTPDYFRVGIQDAAFEKSKPFSI
jgi:Caspase domain.